MADKLFTTGLVSISFRKLSPREIVDLTSKAKLQSIEWGGDVHVPHGDLATARDVAEMTVDAGLSVAAYGSYFRMTGTDKDPAWRDVVASAQALGAPTIRVWAGTQGSELCDAAERSRLAALLHEMAAEAAESGVRVALEYHANTLTDDHAAAWELVQAADHENLDSLWQPPNGWPAAEAIAGLELMLPRVSNVHVFHWVREGDAIIRRPLAEGEAAWKRYLSILQATGKPRGLLLEFCRDDDPAQMVRDAATLNQWVDELPG